MNSRGRGYVKSVRLYWGICQLCTFVDKGERGNQKYPKIWVRLLWMPPNPATKNSKELQNRNACSSIFEMKF